MKKNILLVTIAVLIAWIPFFMGAWDKTLPAGTSAFKDADDEIRANNAALETALDNDHVFTTGGTQTGEHNQITFALSGAAPTVSANEGGLYVLDTDYGGTDYAELYWKDEQANTLQLTHAGKNLQNATYLTASNFAENGAVNLIKAHTDNTVHLGANTTVNGTLTATGAVTASTTLAVTGNVTVNTDKFTVTAASGNTVVAGTLGVTGVATLGDGSLLAAACESGDGDRTIADKAYVDSITDPTYSGGESHTFTGGLIIKGGVVTATGTQTITFGSAFPNAIISVVATDQDSDGVSGGNNSVISAVTTADFTIWINTTAKGIYWIAIGY